MAGEDDQKQKGETVLGALTGFSPGGAGRSPRRNCRRQSAARGGGFLAETKATCCRRSSSSAIPSSVRSWLPAGHVCCAADAPLDELLQSSCIPGIRASDLRRLHRPHCRGDLPKDLLRYWGASPSNSPSPR